MKLSIFNAVLPTEQYGKVAEFAAYGMFSLESMIQSYANQLRLTLVFSVSREVCRSKHFPVY